MSKVDDRIVSLRLPNKMSVQFQQAAVGPMKGMTEERLCLFVRCLWSVPAQGQSFSNIFAGQRWTRHEARDTAEGGRWNAVGAQVTEARCCRKMQ